MEKMAGRGIFGRGFLLIVALNSFQGLLVRQHWRRGGSRNKSGMTIKISLKITPPAPMARAPNNHRA